MNERNVPEVRFRGFSGEWMANNIIDIAPLQRGFDLPRGKMQEGKYPVVMSNGVNGYHSEFKAKAPGVTTGRSGTIGKLHYIEQNYWPHNTALWVTDFKGNIPRYVFYMYQKLNLNRFGTGSGVPTLNRNDVHSVQVFTPNADEQTKIGDFFKNLDNLIVQNQKKYDKLVNMKKACLDKMFPKDGADTPEVRYQGFSGKWEKKCLETQVKFYSGLTYSPLNIVGDGGTLVLRSSNVKNGEVVDADNVYVDSSVVNSQNVKLGDIIVVVRNGSRSLIGKHGQIKVNMKDTVIGAFMTGVESTQPNFINSLLDTMQFDKEIEKNLGATINQITTGSFKKMSFYFTDDVDEQTKIGTFFQTLDTLITAQKTKLEKLKNIKKACLDKMFI